ncbi:hypothetical protein Trydic_g14998 [Trypoxylus dichotomus]
MICREFTIHVHDNMVPPAYGDTTKKTKRILGYRNIPTTLYPVSQGEEFTIRESSTGFRSVQKQSGDVDLKALMVENIPGTSSSASCILLQGPQV